MKDCCQNQDNLGEPERLTPDMVVRKCGVCGAKHYALTVDVAELVGEGVDV